MDQKLTLPDWLTGFGGAITVASRDGTIVWLNDKAAKTWEAHGGKGLIGKKLAGCHKATSVEKIEEIMATGKANAYTIEKAGVHKFIYQGPWIEDGETKGIVELSVEIPPKMEHFVRGG